MINSALYPSQGSYRNGVQQTKPLQRPYVGILVGGIGHHNAIC
jgi:hypothetical protein